MYLSDGKLLSNMVTGEEDSIIFKSVHDSDIWPKADW